MGDSIRSMKSAKQSKSEIDPFVRELQALKAEYESVAGVPFGADANTEKVSKTSKNENKEKKIIVQEKDQSKVSPITPRSEDYSAW